MQSANITTFESKQSHTKNKHIDIDMTNGALSGIRVLDLARVLAGPFCTQMLGDMGADIIKVERPGLGDDTRAWGPPHMADEDGDATSESAYYLSANRNKRSIAIDIRTPEGQELIHELAASCDVLIQNFKPGGLKKYGLDYDQMKERHPHLVYAAISGYGQNGPLSADPGYDLVAQAMGGMMAYTGPDVDGPPTKSGVAVSDIITGLHTAIGILAALRARDVTGKGQLVDVALLDCTMATMTYFCQGYLTTGRKPKRSGNGNPTIVPYQMFHTADDPIIIAIGNDYQFKKFCDFAGVETWPNNPKFATNEGRVVNRSEFVPMMEKLVRTKPSKYWIENLRKIAVPVGPVNTIDQVFEEEQVKARDMRISMHHPLVDRDVDFVGSPLKFSDTPVSYRSAPPVCGQHGDEILREILNMDSARIAGLRAKGTLGRSQPLKDDESLPIACE